MNYPLQRDSGKASDRTARGSQTTCAGHLIGWALLTTTALGGCGGSTTPAPTSDQSGLEKNRTQPGAPEWQPFSKDSVWNLKLPAQRREVALPAAGLAVAPLSASDGDYGIKIYFANDSDPAWEVTYDDYNSATDNWSPPSPIVLRAPATLIPPTGSDGTVIIVDENRQYAYELWRVTVQPDENSATGNQKAHCGSLNQVDLRNSGLHRNVGVTAAGLPGVGGVLRSLELSSGQPIRHKLWLAVHPTLLFPGLVWPASHADVTTGGSHAALRYGDVVGLMQSYDVKNGECHLSPLLQRIAQGLQDYGGIVQDRGGDSVGIVSEVDAVSSLLDDDESALWTELTCLRKYLVRIGNPWAGALPGGLGY